MQKLTDSLPLVSILMVVYNSSEFLEEAITSVLECNYKNIELIISDDCSTDNSVEIISGFDDSRIRFFKNEKNIGEYANRNNCINHANGDFFVFIDGDDTLLKEGLENVIEQMITFKETAFATVISTESEVDCKIYQPKESFRSIFIGKNLFDNSFAGNLFRTKIVKENFGEFPTNLHGGDNMIRPYLSMYFPVLLTKQPFAKWRVREGQASARSRKSVSGLVEPFLIKMYFLYHKDCPLDENEKKVARKKLLKKQIQKSFQLAKMGNYKAFLKVLASISYHFGNKRVNVKNIKKS